MTTVLDGQPGQDATARMPAELLAAAAADVLSERELSRLRWRTRRGLLENDLFIERLFARHAAQLTVSHARGLYALMDLADNELLDVLLQRKPLADVRPDLQSADVTTVLKLLTEKEKT
jgi:antitoxin CptB